MKGARDEAKAQAALEAIREGAKGDENLLALAVVAARARCTLGEISLAMEDVFGRHGVAVYPVKGVYGAAYEGDSRWARVIDGVEAFERRRGRKPRMLVAKMGQRSEGHTSELQVLMRISYA